MPIAPHAMFESAGLALAGTVRWGELPATDAPGVYAISLCSDPRRNEGLLSKAPIDQARVSAWVERVPTFQFFRQLKPEPRRVVEFLSGFWLEDETIVYIGKATSLHARLGQYKRHKLGNRSPHAGGHWIKTLSNLDRMYIHFCVCPTVTIAECKEDAALAIFKRQVSPAIRVRLHNPIPFANREHPRGVCKQDDICGDVLR